MATEKERYRAMNEALIAAGRTNRIQGRLDAVHEAAAMNAKISEIRNRNRFSAKLPAALPAALPATEPAAPISMNDVLRMMRHSDEAG